MLDCLAGQLVIKIGSPRGWMSPKDTGCYGMDWKHGVQGAAKWHVIYLSTFLSAW